MTISTLKLLIHSTAVPERRSLPSCVRGWCSPCRGRQDSFWSRSVSSSLRLPSSTLTACVNILQWRHRTVTSYHWLHTHGLVTVRQTASWHEVICTEWLNCAAVMYNVPCRLCLRASVSNCCCNFTVASLIVLFDLTTVTSSTADNYICLNLYRKLQFASFLWKVKLRCVPSTAKV